MTQLEVLCRLAQKSSHFEWFWVALECVVKLERACFLYTWTLLCWMSGKFTPPCIKPWRCLGETALYCGRTRAAGTALSGSAWYLMTPSLLHDIGFCLSSLSQTHTVTIATFTLVQRLLWWQSGIQLCLKCLKLSLETRDIWSSREIVSRLLHFRRNLVQAPHFPVPKISRYEHSISLNSLRE